MGETSDKKPAFYRDNSMIMTAIVMAAMVIFLVIFVSVQEKRAIITETTLTQTAVQLEAQSSDLLTTEPQVTPVSPAPVVNVNGIVFMGGFLVLIVLAAVLREAFHYPKDPRSS